jgi:hypothetical protein
MDSTSPPTKKTHPQEPIPNLSIPHQPLASPPWSPSTAPFPIRLTEGRSHIPAGVLPFPHRRRAARSSSPARHLVSPTPVLPARPSTGRRWRATAPPHLPPTRCRRATAHLPPPVGGPPHLLPLPPACSAAAPPQLPQRRWPPSSPQRRRPTQLPSEPPHGLLPHSRCEDWPHAPSLHWFPSHGNSSHPLTGARPTGTIAVPAQAAFTASDILLFGP